MPVLRMMVGQNANSHAASCTMLKGRFNDWNATNVAALQRVPTHLIEPQNVQVLQIFAKARTTPLPMRLYYLKRSGVYRQRLIGNIGLLVAALLKRI